MALAVAAVALALLQRWTTLPAWHPLDLDVYLAGGKAVTAHQPLYDVEVHNGVDGILRFTYPPFAGMLFAGLASAGAAAGPVFTAISSMSYVIAVAVCAHVARSSKTVTIVLLVVGLALEPVQRTLLFGQVNLVLLAVVLADAFVVRERWRGWLLGIAIGVKLTPAVLILYYLLRREHRAAAQAVAAFLGTVVAGLVMLPQDSIAYWLHDVHAVGRFGPEARLWGNQAIRAVVDRATQLSDVPEPAVSALVIVLSLAALTLAVLAARRRVALGDFLGALSSVALGGLLVVPISWTHHWVWVVPILFVLARDRSWWWLVTTAVIFFFPPMWGLAHRPNDQLGYSLPELLLSSAWTMWAFGLLALWTTQWRTSGRSPRSSAAVEESPADERAGAMPTGGWVR